MSASPTATNLADEKKIHKDAKLKDLERAGKLQVDFIVTDSTDRSLILLTGAKNIFQKQLPKMPKEYITRLVYCRKHETLVVIKDGCIWNPVGAITIRCFAEQRFAEIVFCAVSADEQVQGYGSYMMNHLKEHVRRHRNVDHFLTYADNYAVGYFKKQGFTKDISTFPREIWGGCIKDYDGGTLMLCTFIPRINYLETFETLRAHRESVLRKIYELLCAGSGTDSPFKPYASVAPLLQQKKEVLTANSKEAQVLLQPHEIPGVVEAGWTPAMQTANAHNGKRGRLFEVLRPLLTELQNHPSSWPFLQPVNRTEVPEYYEVIRTPMDLSTMEDSLDGDRYTSLKAFERDFDLIVANCKSFNDPATQYYKCAERLAAFFTKKVALIRDKVN